MKNRVGLDDLELRRFIVILFIVYRVCSTYRHLYHLREKTRGGSQASPKRGILYLTRTDAHRRHITTHAHTTIDLSASTMKPIAAT